MSNITDIVQISITRETQSIAVAGFGTPGIISEFASDATTATFDRYRYYSDLAEMVSDGWGTTTEEYKRANFVFAQNPSVDRIMIGRKNPKSELVETWTEALTAIVSQSNDWYAFTINPTAEGKIVYTGDFVTDNVINVSVNGVAISSVTFDTDHATTMLALKAQIEADITDSTATVDLSDVTGRTLLVEIESGDITLLTSVVTLGATQPTATISFETGEDIEEVSTWAETQKKIYFFTTNDADVVTNSTIDIVSVLKDKSLDRTVACYHSGLQDDNYFAEGFFGEALPYDPGSQTWAYKGIAGLSSYALTSGERTFALDKNCNIYTTTAGVNVTESGTVVGGEYIDIIRGLDWLEARMAENIFGRLVNTRKIPYTDDGITIIEGLVRESLSNAVTAGLLTTGYVVTVPKVATISQADKIARNLPDVKFTATLQGAIHTVQIQGTVSV